MRRVLAAAACLAVTLSACALTPISRDRPLGVAYLKAHHERRGDVEVCDLDVSAGLEATNPNVSATFCLDQFRGKADSVSGQASQEQALQAWEQVDAARQARVTEAVEKLVPLLGPAVCVGLVVFGVPVPPSVCAAVVAKSLPVPDGGGR